MAGEPGPLQMARRTKAGSALMECGPRVRSGFLAERLLTTGGDRPPDTNEAPSPTPIRRSFYPVPSERGGAEGRSKAESHRAISYLATSTSRTSPFTVTGAGLPGSTGTLPSSRPEGSDPNKGTAVNGSPALPTIPLPKGGGDSQGRGERFVANPITVTDSLSVPIYTSPGRPALGLSSRSPTTLTPGTATRSGSNTVTRHHASRTKTWRSVTIGCSKSGRLQCRRAPSRRHPLPRNRAPG